MFGSAAFKRHFLLRFLLYCENVIPFRVIQYLDFCTDRILLRKVGGGYIFIHGMLMEYIASLTDDGTKELAARIGPPRRMTTKQPGA